MNVEKKINQSFKWSAITEILVKLITPILNAILARILIPDAFAPLATITMIISFGEVFVESGFKKFLIQHDFNNEEDYRKSLDVALWSNVIISTVIWGFIAIFSRQLAEFLGSPNIWLAITISGVILPLHSICGILSGKIQKHFQFKKLFVVRIVTALIPLFVTIPLALSGLDYWSLIIGNIASILAQMIVLFIVSKHRIHFYFSFKIFKNMYSYGIWTMFDGIAIWLTTWIDSFIIARYMNEYYLGLYKNSVNTVNALFSIVTAAVVPVLFVALSKYQNDEKQFSDFFNSTQRRLALILIPLGIGVFLYRDLAVQILFGDNWVEAANIVGITALTSALRTIFVSICSDAYRAKGKFKTPFFIQIADLCLLLPVCTVAAQNGFWTLVYARALIKLVLIVPEFIIMKKILNIDTLGQLKQMTPIFISVTIMSIVCAILKLVSSGWIWSFISIFIAIVVYGIVLMCFSNMRKEIFDLDFMKKIKGKIHKVK